MKKTIPTAMATATLLLSTASYADSDWTAYGKANISLNSIEQESSNPQVDEWQLNSNASRLGVKGSVAVNEHITAIFKMEFEVNIDDGSSSSSKGSDTFEQRNIYLGFTGDFGTLIAGKHDTPLKLAQGKIDRFNDQVLGDIKNFAEGEDRASNIIMYTTPKYSGLSATLALIPGEDSKNSNDDGLADGSSVSINYKTKQMTLALARNEDVDAQDTTRLAADFSIGDAKLGLLWQRAERVDGTDEEDSWLLSGQYKLAGNWLAKAQYGVTDYDAGGEDTQMVAGIDLKLNKQSKIFAYYAIVEHERVDTTQDDSSFAVGYELKF